MIKRILNPAICLALGCTGMHFFRASNFDNMVLCIVIFVMWMFIYLED